MSSDKMGSSRRKKGCPDRVKPSDYCSKEEKESKRGGKKRTSNKREKTKNSNEKQSGKRCIRPGPKTRNPFLNFLRDVRKRHCEWSITKIAIEGAKCWCRMPKHEKQKYYNEACSMQKKSKKNKKEKTHRNVKKHSSRSKKRC
ncbi:protamine-like [Diorhabda carinulata]|uniref:protamine-like n=1 Tax=Diorhabda carinulata TaxID=1163345 RepID=UPI0025A00534|nr:protamine-like [Diorhabda carinulata]